MAMTPPLYFDYAATTPVDQRVADAMMACLTKDGRFGNPASRSHFYGWQAEQIVEQARSDVANLINADPREIVFTSGATEANNLAIKGLLEQRLYFPEGKQAPHIVTSSIEHKAVLDACGAMQELGCKVTYIAPDTNGRTNIKDITDAITSNTVLVSFMHVNNETGVESDIRQVGQVCQSKGCFFHVDASQSAGKICIDVKDMAIDLLSLSAHKMYGPKGVGALYVRRRADMNLRPQIHGGGHERGLRSGTLPTHQLAGLGEACRMAASQLEDDQALYRQLQDRLLSQLSKLSQWQINAQDAKRVPGIINIAFEHVDGEVLLTLLHDVALSTGSACTSATVEPSYVLQAMGLKRELAHSSLRISFGRYTTLKDVDTLVEKIYHAVTSLRSSAA